MCGLCDLWSCPACHEVKGSSDAPHTCDPDKVRTVQLIAKEARPCPKCGVPICKIEGCDQMWCTNCNTGFHWRTGRLAHGPLHNPHYFTWLRSIGVAQPTAAHRHAAYLGENPCDDVAVDRAVVDALRGKTDATKRFMLHIVEHDVSRVARAPGGFLHEYLRVGPRMLDEIAPGGRITWRQKRTNFIRRQYRTHRTERRRLALIAWAYDPR